MSKNGMSILPSLLISDQWVIFTVPVSTFNNKTIQQVRIISYYSSTLPIQ
jgi:hypothetical protein